MKGFILAAGLGTRLRPLTEKIAKPALPILGVPTFWFGASHLATSLGLSDLLINCSHAPETLKAAVQDPALIKGTGLRFHVSDESSGILGSSGALWKIQEQVTDEPLAVYNGDCISRPDWKRLLKQHQKSKGLMTLHLRKFQGTSENYTDVSVDAFGRVTGFGAKTNSGVMFTGAYIIEPQAMRRLPAGKSDLMTTLLKPLSDERQLFAVVEDAPWLDTGSPATYAAAQFELLKLMPEFAAMADLKSREISPGVRVPADWSALKNGAALRGPAVFHGDWSGWKKLLIDAKQVFGPRFVGLGPPQTQKGPFENQICFDSHSIPI